MERSGLCVVEDAATIEVASLQAQDAVPIMNAANQE